MLNILELDIYRYLLGLYFLDSLFESKPEDGLRMVESFLLVPTVFHLLKLSVLVSWAFIYEFYTIYLNNRYIFKTMVFIENMDLTIFITKDHLKLMQINLN